MVIELDDFIKQLPESEQQAIKARTDELIREESILRDLRAAQNQTVGGF